MPFPTKHAVVTTFDGRNVVLIQPLIYITNNGEVITVPVQATSDGASTPPFIWSIPGLAPFGAHWLGAVVHDWLYRGTQEPKDFCDNIFKEAMLSCGVGEVEAETIYLAVKFAGEKAFEDDRKAETMALQKP